MTAVGEGPLLFADLALARRLERAEARTSADFVETRARLFPDSGACWIRVAGAYALYDGPASPVTQTFGLGMEQPLTGADLDRIEQFFRERGAPVYHEVSPLADPTVPALLNERGYQPFEFTSVLFRPLGPDVRLAAPHNERIRVRLVEPEDQDLWAQTGARGWSESREFADQLLDIMRVSGRRQAARAFLAELGGKAIAAGVLSICEGVAFLAGASTIPEARQQGAQLLLLESRLRAGAAAGCDLALMGALPGSASQRNAERHGFRIAYTRLKWRLPTRAG